MRIQLWSYNYDPEPKLMNFMGYGIPTVASARQGSEVGRIITNSEGGWVTASADTGQLAATLAHVLRDSDARRDRGEAARVFAAQDFSAGHVAEGFEVTLTDLLDSRSRRGTSAVGVCA